MKSAPPDPGIFNRLLSVFVMVVALCHGSTAWAELEFINMTDEASAGYLHGYAGERSMPLDMSAGVAAGDYDNDGDVDLYLITGDAYPNVLLRNDGGGSFTDLAAQAGVELAGLAHSGPVFADIDGDGWLDLLVGGLEGSTLVVFKNKGDGTFEDGTEASGIVQEVENQNDFSIALGDPDSDGDLDIYIGHWGTPGAATHLWMNEGAGTFHKADHYAGVAGIYTEGDNSFTPAFVDINGDARQDLLVASDFVTSHTLINNGNLQFENTTTEVIDDVAGMGSAIGDFDNDGDMDWFVTAIWWAQQKKDEGNRLYQNDGEGNFTNITEASGVVNGDWGWGACTADFDNDGWLDIFHVNGMPWETKTDNFFQDRSKLFMNSGAGTFEEKSAEHGLHDRGMGKGVVCFDADNDGDIDIFTNNVQGESQYYQNSLSDNPGWLQVRLDGELNNPSAVAARIEVTTGELKQLREVRIGSNYQSQDPLLQHFGLGGAQKVDLLKVTWPHGGETILADIDPNQRLTLSALQSTPPPFLMKPGISAAWVDPELAREGFVIEILPGGVAVMFWFTYDNAGNQDWYIGVGTIKGRRIFFDSLLSVSGSHFGPDTVPENIAEDVVGRAAFTWTGCDTGFMDWEIGENMGHQTLIRLTRMMGVECGDPSDHPVLPESVWSGAWIDPDRDGEGFTLEIVEDGTAVIFWFGFDKASKRRWTLGVGKFTDGKLEFNNVLTTRGGKFADPDNDSNAREVPWGTLELDMNCKGGTAVYESSEEGFGNGTYTLRRMTSIDTLDCD